MKRSVSQVLRAALALFGALATESVVVAYLVSKGLAVEWLSRGKAILERATSLRDARNAMRRTIREMTSAIRTLFEEAVPEVNAFRLAARKALARRPDLIAALGVGRKKRTIPSKTDAQTPPPVEEKARPKGGNQVASFVEQARGPLSAAIERPEVLSMLEPFGYDKASIEGLLAKVEGLSAKELEHEDRKNQALAATAQLHGAMQELRDWLLPAKKRLLNALRGRPDLKKMIADVE